MSWCPEQCFIVSRCAKVLQCDRWWVSNHTDVNSETGTLNIITSYLSLPLEDKALSTSCKTTNKTHPVQTEMSVLNYFLLIFICTLGWWTHRPHTHPLSLTDPFLNIIWDTMSFWCWRRLSFSQVWRPNFSALQATPRPDLKLTHLLVKAPTNSKTRSCSHFAAVLFHQYPHYYEVVSSSAKDTKVAALT